MQQRSFSIWSVLLSLVFIASCGAEDDQPEPEPLSGSGLIVLNEGGFQKGNSSITFIPEEAFSENSGVDVELEFELFEKENGIPLGDVGHSIVSINDLLYVVMNNSGMIRVLDPENFSEKARIEGLTSPRYIVPISDSKAYVSDLYANAISIVDLNSHQVTGQIQLRGKTEKMVVYRNEVYVSNNENEHIFTIDIETDSITDSINIGGYSNELFIYKAQVAAIRNAQSVEDVKGAIVIINTLSHTLSTITEFEYDEKMWYARGFSNSTNSLYFAVGSTVYHFETGIITKLFDTEGFSPYNLFVLDDNIWLTDAKDYQQRGEVIQYNSSGERMSSFTTGVIPNQLLFLFE